MFNIYIKRKKDKRFQSHWYQTDDLEKAEQRLEKMVRRESELGNNGVFFQIRDGRKIICKSES
jgi:hypothetical protein